MDTTIDREQDLFHQHIKNRLKTIFDIEDTHAIELFGLLHRLANLSEAIECQLSGALDLSGPRWRLMMRLLAAEHMGNPDGITPTILSRSQRVSKNTISALLRGLEDQGLIQRTLDPKDLRVFRIQLTPKGREVIMQEVPKRVEGANSLIAVMPAEEVEQLMILLEKLHRVLAARYHPCEKQSDN